ncbi:hypothetical protein [Leptospira kirschneri]|uniref:hypothetical protein n=1 Tax=Leptospira kirschneri TaxID=29507 RepID=UPI0003099A16|nr:hypothetical protein [Leptospira kirschneri]
MNAKEIDARGTKAEWLFQTKAVSLLRALEATKEDCYPVYNLLTRAKKSGQVLP